jgi:hypothetical protein
LLSCSGGGAQIDFTADGKLVFPEGNVVGLVFVASDGTNYEPQGQNLPSAYLVSDLSVHVEATLLKGHVTPGGGAFAITINRISK